MFLRKKPGKEFTRNTRRNPMKDSSITSHKVQQQMKRFSQIVGHGVSKPKQKFIAQMMYGIQATRDVKISNIARSLQEDIALIKTEQRLSNQGMNKDLSARINITLLERSSDYIRQDTVLAFDLSDIHKPFAKKMDYLAKVWDGSVGKPNTGYWLSEVIGVNVHDENPIPLYSELYSHEADGFESENDQIMTAIKVVNVFTKGRGIWTMDRAADRKILVGELGNRNLRFVIRAKGKRHFKDTNGKTWEMPELLKGMRYKDQYTVTIDREGYLERKEVRLAIRHNLMIENTRVSLVVIKGFGKEPMLLITNVNKSPRELLEIYLTRWKCEESFRFLKQEYHLEDVRVRSYAGLRNMIVLMHAVFYFLSVYLGRRLKMQILLNKILEKAKRFFEIPAFKHYAVADGIYRLLFNKKWQPNQEIEKPDFSAHDQLSLELP